MQLFRNLLIYSLIAVILPWGALAQAAAPQALFSVVPASSEITQASYAAVHVTAKQKRCRVAILTGAPCFAAIIAQGRAAISGDLQERDALFMAAITLPKGVTTGGFLDPPRQG